MFVIIHERYYIISWSQCKDGKIWLGVWAWGTVIDNIYLNVRFYYSVHTCRNASSVVMVLNKTDHRYKSKNYKLFIDT